jgi:hypothetical protein
MRLAHPVLLTATLAVMPQVALAQDTHTWTGASNTIWANPGNWNSTGGGIPTVGDDASLQLGQNFSVLMNSAYDSANRLGDVTVAGFNGGEASVIHTNNGDLFTENLVLSPIGGDLVDYQVGGGRVDVLNSLVIGNFGTATMSLSSGGAINLRDSAFATIGGNGGQGQLIINGGFFGDFASSADAPSAVTVTSGSSSSGIDLQGGSTQIGFLELRSDGPAQSTLTIADSGSIPAYLQTQSFSIGHAAVDHAGGNVELRGNSFNFMTLDAFDGEVAEYNISGGSFDARASSFSGVEEGGLILVQDFGGQATINQSGGFFGTDTLSLSGEDANYNMSGGSLSVFNLGIGGSSFDFTGGDITAQSIDLSGTTGTLTLAGGSLSYQEFRHDGGQIVGDLVNDGEYTFFVGGLDGDFINRGSLTIFPGSDAFAPTGDLINQAELTIADNVAITPDGDFLNQDALTLNGGTVSVGGTLRNAAILTGHGTVTGQVRNEGLWQVEGGTLTLDTGNTTNVGTMTIDTGRAIEVNGLLDNRGLLRFDNALIRGVGLTNGPGGVIDASGTIDISSFQNGGVILVDDGTLNMAGGSWDNAGLVVLDGVTSTLAGGDINNTFGSITGRGTIAANINNASQVLAQDGTLRIAAALDNQAGGTAGAETGATLVLAQNSPVVNDGTIDAAGRVDLAGDLTNNGDVSAIGGTLNVTGLTTNAGQIAGRDATLRFNGGVQNNGQVLFSFGTSDVFGPITNTTGGGGGGGAASPTDPGQIIISGNSNTTFYGDIENQADALFKVSEGSTAVIFGDFANRADGQLDGSGTVFFEGEFTFGNSPDIQTVPFDTNYSSTSSILIELGGTIPGAEHDKLIFGGDVTFAGGTLNVVLIDPNDDNGSNVYQPMFGDEFDIFDYQMDQSGAFGTINLPSLSGGLSWDVTDLYQDGDALTFDGIIRVVPEPSSLVVLMLGAGLLSGRTRAGRHRAGLSAARVRLVA